MVGTRDLAWLAEAAERAEAKLVLVGDDRQLPLIQAGGAFHALAERLPRNELREVRRQHHGWDRQALDALRSGEVERWARAYRDHGQITVGDSVESVRAALVNDWSRAGGDRLMIAARRGDVADLNQRARQLLQDQGDLGPDELAVAAGGFATGDRVIGARNDRRAGIPNGQRGAISATDAVQRSVDVALDDGRSIRLGPDYLDAGHLDHGYAITAHRAQGATVDRTFVLGSEELYREWGYTALSRHREQARFYVARGDLHPDPELPPPADPLVFGIAKLMQRSQAKQLALESLPQADREQLEQERRKLRGQLSDQPPPRRLPHVEKRELEADVHGLENARERERLLRERRERLRWRDRSARADIDNLLERNLDEQQERSAELRKTVATVTAAKTTDHDWLDTHGPEATRFLAVDHELRARDSADHHAARRVDALDRDPLDRQLPTQHLELARDDLDLDLGL